MYSTRRVPAEVLSLTPRQVEVCVLAGCFGVRMSDKAIARELGISVRTVQDHMNAGAARIRETLPFLHGSPRHVCQAWLRQSYHAMYQSARQAA